jgi:hypothetical protein
MKTSEYILERLLEVGRRPPPPEPSAAPPLGFSTRVAARWAADRPAVSALPLWEDLSRHAARLLAVGAIVAGLTAWAGWQPAPAEVDAILETELLSMLPLS